MASVDSYLPLSISEVAARHGLHRTEVATLILTHAVPTVRIGSARCVTEAGWPELRRLLGRYLEAKSAAV